MRLIVIAVGRLKAGPERELCARYLERAVQLGRAMGLRGPDIIELEESRARDAAQRMSEEAAQIRQKAGSAQLVLLDERGQSPDSAAFSAQIGRLRDGGNEALAFVIGGADGLAPALRAEAQQVISLGAMTWPHQIVRVLVLEQIYRAMTILAGHPYHRV